jgi:hypothetical protein
VCVFLHALSPIRAVFPWARSLPLSAMRLCADQRPAQSARPLRWCPAAGRPCTSPLSKLQTPVWAAKCKVLEFFYQPAPPHQDDFENPWCDGAMTPARSWLWPRLRALTGLCALCNFVGSFVFWLYQSTGSLSSGSRSFSSLPQTTKTAHGPSASQSQRRPSSPGARG